MIDDDALACLDVVDIRIKIKSSFNKKKNLWGVTYTIAWNYWIQISDEDLHEQFLFSGDHDYNSHLKRLVGFPKAAWDRGDVVGSSRSGVFKKFKSLDELSSIEHFISTYVIEKIVHDIPTNKFLVVDPKRDDIAYGYVSFQSEKGTPFRGKYEVVADDEK